MERTTLLMDTHDWTCIRGNGHIQMSKPPLQYFLGALLLKSGIPLLFALRLPSLVFSLGTLVFVALLASRLAPGRSFAPIFAVFLLLSSKFFVELSATAFLDSGYAFFIVASVYFLLRAQEVPE